MKTFVIITIILGVSCALDQQWTNFKINFSRVYKNSAEETTRFKIFNARISEINKHNELYEQGLVTYKKGINKFTDMTDNEIKPYSKGLGNLNKISTSNFKYLKYGKNPESIDWRDVGAISKVKNQGGCGSCWAFSTTGAIEAHTFLYRNASVSLSAQNLVDCVKKNYGCGGGWPSAAMRYVRDNRGIDDESSYPYEGIDNNCRYTAAVNKVQVKQVMYIRKYDEAMLENAVAMAGPVTVCLDATGLPFYESGIYSSETCDPEFMGHSVLAVGYGVENGKEFWIFQNSWGESWGEKGYFKLARNANNMCGIATTAAFPIVDHDLFRKYRKSPSISLL